MLNNKLLVFAITTLFVSSSNCNREELLSLGELELIAIRDSKLTAAQLNLLVDNFDESKLVLKKKIVTNEGEIQKNVKFLRKSHLDLIRKVSQKKEDNDSLSQTFLLNNHTKLYGLCQRLLNEEIRLRLIGAQDKKIFEIRSLISWIVAELNKVSREVFLNKQVEFYSKIRGLDFEKKVLLEYFRNESLGWNLENDPIKASLFIAKGITLAKELNDTKAILDFYRRIQYLLRRFYGFNSLSLALGEHILQQTKKNQNYYLEAIIFDYNGEAHRSKGEYQAAFEAYSNALEIYSAYNHPTRVNYLKERIAVVYKHMGKFNMALSQYETLLSQNSGTSLKMRYFHGMGMIYMEMGDFHLAEYYLEKALNLCREIHDLTNMVIFLGDLANLNLKLGDDVRAREFIFEALQIPDDKVSPSPIIFAWQHLGELYLEQKDWQTAEAHLQKAQALSSTYNYGFQNAKNNFLIAKLHFKKNTPDSALKFMYRSLTKLKEMGDICGKIETLNLAGEIYMQKNEYNMAEKKFIEAQKLSRALPQYANDWEINYNLAKVEIERGKDTAVEKFLAQSIEQIEMLATQLTDYEKRVSFSHKIQSPFEEMVLLQLRQGNREAAFAYSDNSRAQVLKLLIEENKNESQLAAAGFMNLLQDEETTLKKLQARLDENSAVLEYEITEDELIIWCIRNDTLAVKQVTLTRTAADSVTAAFKDEMDVKKVETPEKADSSYARVMKASRFLYDHLLAPVDSLISGIKTLYIVPDENLHHLPLAALMDTDSTFLLQRVKLAYSASAEILAQTLEESDNVFQGSEKSLLTVSVDKKGQPFEDAVKVAALYERTSRLTGENATQANFTEALHDMNYDNVLFSLHGYLSEKPMNSYLRLYAASDTGDSRLTVADIMKLKMHGTDLVYMAACESASGLRAFRGEGVVSLQRAFMIAGVKTIIGNLWKVETETTGELTVRFFKNLENFDKVEALRQAQLQTIDYFKKEHFYEIPHPYFWAPLTLSGAVN